MSLELLQFCLFVFVHIAASVFFTCTVLVYKCVFCFVAINAKFLLTEIIKSCNSLKEAYRMVTLMY